MKKNPDIEDFLVEFGYYESAESLKEGFKAYRACKNTYEEIHKMFNEQEINILNEEFKDY